MRSFTLLLLALALASMAHAAVKYVGSATAIYSRSPKLRIPLTGIPTDVASEDIDVVLSSSAGPLTPGNKFYAVTKNTTASGVVLKLLDGKQWGIFSDVVVPPVNLHLTQVYFTDSQGIKVPQLVGYDADVIVARLLRTPSVDVKTDLIYETGTKTIVLSGTGLKGAKTVKLFFDPPMFLGVDYQISGGQFDNGLKKDQVTLSLQDQHRWKSTDGELRLVAIDTGGGAIALGNFNDDDSVPAGIVIAKVGGDEAGHKVTVTDTEDVQMLYNTESPLVVKGSNFNPSGTKLKFANGLALNANYTIATIDDKAVVAKLIDGKKWRANAMTLPGLLNVLQVDAGSGFVDVGATNANKGVNVASIYQHPAVHTNRDADNKERDPVSLYRTHSHELWIYGEGFIPHVKAEYGINQFKFSPALASTDYSVFCDARDKVIISLKDGKSWAKDGYTGPLKVVAVKTKGDAVNDKDWVSVGVDGKGVTVATIADDVASAETGGISIIPSTQKVYASVRNDVLTVFGQGFVTGLRVTFFSSDFEDSKALTLIQDKDFILTVKSENELTFTRKADGMGWMEAGKSGPLFLATVTPPSAKKEPKTYELAGGEGIRIAIVYEDPMLDAASESDTLHNSQSKVAYLYGAGFTTKDEMDVTIRPSTRKSYKIISASDGQFRVQLSEGSTWLPEFYALTKRVPLTVTSIDTGAGPYALPDGGVVVAYIVADREGVVCDDSCEYSFDGVCDESYGGDGDWYSYYDHGNWDDAYYAEYAYYYDYGDIDDFAGQNVDDDYIATAYSYLNGGSYGNWAYSDDFAIGACLQGTDCTDCGGVDQYIDWNTAEPNADDDYVDDACVNTCAYARDGVCDDPRSEDYCALGTDCQDCGPVGHSNFSSTMDDMWWDDDDYWLWDDDYFMSQTAGLDANRHRLDSSAEETEVSTFLIILEGVVYAVGGGFLLVGSYIAYKVATGSAGTVYQALAMELTPEELEMVPSQGMRMAITPDTLRT